MDTRHNIIRLTLFSCLLLIAASGVQAQQIKPGMMLKARKDSVSSGFFHSTLIDVDTANALTRSYIKRLADSVAALRAGQDYVVYRLYGVLGSAASDSVNLQVGVNGVYEAIRPNFNITFFNFSIVATTPSEQISTFNTGLPTFSNADSLFIVRVSRNDAMSPKCAVTIYKLPKNYGPDVNDKTVGTYYDMIRFSDTVLPAGANRFFTLDLAVRRQP